MSKFSGIKKNLLNKNQTSLKKGNENDLSKLNKKTKKLNKNQTSLKKGNENGHIKIFSNFQLKINSKLCLIEKLFLKKNTH
ncbi:hypothetical protein BpHYR1_053333 [Brachionus plicatilis]|uniref:Uncharacterized protein n=1 Tax=Brachionus plicatilis TaxID=10195 RepID=A0A3M7QPQ0_BRAPC|nr:hypothetical protein BpHYR1_053333 [Brachionus plicatilis]